MESWPYLFKFCVWARKVLYFISVTSSLFPPTLGEVFYITISGNSDHWSLSSSIPCQVFKRNPLCSLEDYPCSKYDDFCLPVYGGNYSNSSSPTCLLSAGNGFNNRLPSGFRCSSCLFLSLPLSSLPPTFLPLSSLPPTFLPLSSLPPTFLPLSSLPPSCSLPLCIYKLGTPANLVYTVLAFELEM